MWWNIGNELLAIKTNVTMQLKDQTTRFMIDVQCMNHHINLVLQKKIMLSIMGKIKNVL